MWKVFAVPALVVVCMFAGLVGAWFMVQINEAETVEADSRRADKGIRIAMLNLEDAARRSPLFQQLRGKWEAAQQELQAQREEIQIAYRRAQRELQRARLEGGSEDAIMALEVEMQAQEQTLKAINEHHETYLQALLTKYQTDVLREVISQVETYVRLEGYDIVLQDYTVESGGDGFFGGAYAQTMINKPVLHAPGVRRNTNAYVTDITDAVVQRMGGMAETPSTD